MCVSAPAVKLGVMEGQLGEPLTLNCSDSHPTPGVWWHYRGANVSSTPQLQLPVLSCGNLGTYICLNNSGVLEVVDVEVQGEGECVSVRVSM